MPVSEQFFSIVDVYIAYRKAKAEAFYETTHFHALAYAEYEQDLQANLARLHKRLIAPEPSWHHNLAQIGDFAYLPKSIDPTIWDGSETGHFRAMDPMKDWARRFGKARKRAPAKLRLVIKPTVDFQIISALWIIKVGHHFDAAIDTKLSFGSRLRRENYQHIGLGPDLNLRSPGLFEPYFSAYQRWREQGLTAMDSSLAAGQSILAITMDIEQFYHRVIPRFILRQRFLQLAGIELTPQEREFTRFFLSALETWYESTPDYLDRPEGALPVDLTASKVIANVLLAFFDKLISERLSPIYYGRYVDDIFLVFENPKGLGDSREVMRWLADRLKPYAVVPRDGSELPSLTLKLPYAPESELIFKGSKQKIFSLASSHGRDLIEHIRGQIRAQSSEYRLLPSVPESGAEMASKALLVTPDATLQADALRKADVVSVRRLGFSLLLRDIEVYSEDAEPESWRAIRQEFYGLVCRHLLTPVGFFEFVGYLPKAFGLMLACGDFKFALRFLRQFEEVVDLIRRTSELGSRGQRQKFQSCIAHCAYAFRQVAMQSATARRVELGRPYLRVVKRLERLDPGLRVPQTVAQLKSKAREVLLADWGRRPYKDYWYLDQDQNEAGPTPPTDASLRRALRLGGIRQFTKLSENLKVPYWPALAFPTRPLSFAEISAVAPKVLENPRIFRRMLTVLRGARVGSLDYLGFEAELSKKAPPSKKSPPPREPPRTLLVSAEMGEDLVLAVASYKTTLQQWGGAAKGNPDRSSLRLSDLNNLINRILQEKVRPDYILFPELSIPRRWALRIAKKLAMTGVSFLAGVEYYRHRPTNSLRNDYLVSLATRWPGYKTHVIHFQPKFAPAHQEKEELLKLGGRAKFFVPTGSSARPVVYVHGDFCFSALICSDLTNIDNRSTLRGEIDALFVLEWNQDVKTFSSLVEATANDLHAFVAQVNNREFGDSRVRAPAVKEYLRDVIQVKGGCSDFYVLGAINFKALRKEQRRKPADPTFKPTPIGYRMSKRRKMAG